MELDHVKLDLPGAVVVFFTIGRGVVGGRVAGSTEGHIQSVP